MTNKPTLRQFSKTALILIAAGIAASFILRNNLGTSGAVFAADMLFMIAIAFLCWGLLHLIGNLDMFASLLYGVKCLRKVIRGKQDPAEQMKDEYLEYRKSRKHHGDVPLLMLCAAGFSVLSLAIALLMC